MASPYTDCWKKRGGPYGMCCVEHERLKALLKAHAKTWDEAKPDMFFTHAYEIRIRGSGIGPSYAVLFDGDKDEIDITHFEHA